MLSIPSLALRTVTRSTQQMLLSSDFISKCGPKPSVASVIPEHPDPSSLQGVTSCHRLFQFGG